MLCGVVSIFIPFHYVLIVAGGIIVAHDVLYHTRVGWKNRLLFKKVERDA